jgi:hypothetical protein
LLALLLLAVLILVVGGAALAGPTLVVSFPASERTPQITPAGIARVGEKENPAVPTAGPAPAQLRLGSQDRAQQHVIRQDQLDHRAVPIPVGRKPKMLPDLDC